MMNMKSSKEDTEGETLLSSSDVEQDDLDSLHSFRTRQRTNTKRLRWSLALNIALVVGFSIYLIFSHLASRYYTRIPKTFYSPADSAVSYKTTVFRGATPDDTTEYQGPSDEVNQRWEDLYNLIGMTEITGPEAARLPNATSPLGYDRSAYIVQLDVFHQLHCLNMLRKRLYPGAYPRENANDDETVLHLSHCVDSLRQSVMCHGDTATINWFWDPDRGHMRGNMRTTHMCRDFGRIRAWAAQRRLRGEFEFGTFVEGAPGPGERNGEWVH